MAVVNGRLVFLLDSNVLFALEPYGIVPTEPYDVAARFVRLAQDNGHLLAVHEATRKDIQRDRDIVRRAHRLQVLEKYRLIRDVPASTRLAVEAATGTENDRVDAAIAAGLDANAAHYLVTEDARLRRRLRSLGPDLGHRVLSLGEAVELLDALHPAATAPPPPLVELVPCYTLAMDDPIFESLRADYAPTFDPWFAKCQAEHREAFIIRAEDHTLAGICVLKDEDDREYGLPPHRLKLCTLKVAESSRGQRLGELLIKAALDNAIARRRAGLSLTVFDWHVELIGLIEDLGFVEYPGRTALGELVFWRSLEPPADALRTLDPFEYHRRYGPYHLNADVPIHVVPIRPHWEERLFPEGKLQLDLLGGTAACGNGLRKAYLTASSNRVIARGDLVLFYRSEDNQGVRFTAVVEETFASSDPFELARFVGTRTVYTEQEIHDLTKNGEKAVNAILLRQARRIDPPWSLTTLIHHKIFRRAPQSIQKVIEAGAQEWVREQIGA